MKFLKEELNVKKKGEVEVEFNPLTSSIQASLITLAVDKSTIGRVKLAQLIMHNVITKLTIKNQEYDAKHVADHADISDAETVNVFFVIASLVMEEALLNAPIKKKSNPLGSQSEQESNASVVHEVAAANHQASV
jgi:hypothetical protein